METTTTVENGNGRRWASDSLGDRPVQLMEDLLSKMPISLIASNVLHLCDADDLVAEVLQDPRFVDFDQIPVHDGDGIIGVLVRDSAPSSTRTRDAMQPLREGMVMAADASLLDFVEQADVNRFALLLEGKEVSAIVTLSDLQKVAVRPALFSLVTLVEMLLAEWIRLNSSGDEWLSALSPGTQRRIQQRFDRLQEHNLVVDKITATMIEEKIKAAANLANCPGGSAAETELGEIALLRNSVFHHHDFGETERNAVQVCERVRLARKYIELLETAMRPQDESRKI
jgi:hypothetical protein